MRHGAGERNREEYGIGTRRFGACKGPVLGRTVGGGCPYMSQLLWCGWSHGAGLGLLGNDLVFDLVVGGLGNDFFVDEIQLGAIGAASDDFRRIGVADAG